MKKIAFAAVTAFFASSAANAADLILPTSSEMYAATSVYDWSGFYAGVNAGYGWAETETLGVTFDEYEGILGGVQAGYNHDFGGFVLGVEGDIQVSNIGYEETVLPGVTAEGNLDYFGTVRARAGIAVDRFLPYVTGGLAFGGVTVEASGPGGSVSVDDNYFGYTVGAGVEFAATDNITVKGEYLYLDLGDADFGTGTDVSLDAHIVRAGVNFKF